MWAEFFVNKPYKAHALGIAGETLLYPLPDAPLCQVRDFADVRKEYSGVSEHQGSHNLLT